MIKKGILALFVMTMLSCTQAEIQSALNSVVTSENGSLSIADVGKGLKEALTIGISKGASRLSQTDGYLKSSYKILLPPEARKVTEKLKNVPGFSNVENIVLEKINRGAEDAAKKAKPIFVDAIKQMTFADAMDILMGQSNAATNYLHRVTYDKLYQEFNPVIVSSLDKFNARDYWEKAVTVYNKLPFVEKANPDLDDYVTGEALVGLFGMVEKEERNIRSNISARPSDLLKRVFAKQDK